MQKIITYLKNHIPTRRRLIQLYTALLYNANIKGFITGNIFHGKTKGVCVPGFNCYSCPGAIGACPLGSLQNALGHSKKGIPYYVLGIILLYAIIFGRTICGYLCPVGLFQELLYKIKTPKLKKSKVTRAFSYTKYLFLIVLVLIIPAMYGLYNVVVPSFCKYICPVGTFEGAILLLSNPANFDLLTGLGPLFTWKFTLFIIIVVCSIFIFRFFCRFICPLGALYSLFNRFSFIGVKVIDEKCIHCGKCINVCKVDIKKVGDHECVNCGECISSCPTNAIIFKGKRVTINNIEEDKVTKPNEQMIEEQVEINNNNKPNKKKNIIRFVSLGIAILTLIGTITYSFIGDTKINKLKTNEEFIVNTFEDKELKIDDLKEKTSILYFFNQIDEIELEEINSYSSLNINLVAICTYEIKEEVKEFVKGNEYMITFAYENENNLGLKSFDKNSVYPSIVVLDNNGMAVSIYKENLDLYQINKEIQQLIGGLIVGNRVGNICPSQDIPLYFSDEEYFSVNDNRGKILIINFWNTKCGPCIAEMPELNQIAIDYKKDVVAITIHGNITYSNNVEKEILKLWPDWEERAILFGQDDFDENCYFERLGGSDAFPWTFVVDKEGIIYKIYHNQTSYENLKNDIETILKSNTEKN